MSNIASLIAVKNNKLLQSRRPDELIKRTVGSRPLKDCNLGDRDILDRCSPIFRMEFLPEPRLKEHNGRIDLKLSKGVDS